MGFLKRLDGRRKPVVVLAVLFTMSLTVVSALLAEEAPTTTVQEGTETADDTLVQDFETKIDEQEKKIRDLQGKIDQYKKNIETKQKEAKTLANEIILVEERIEKKELDIESQEIMIEKLGLGIVDLVKKIRKKGEEMEIAKEELSRTLKILYLYDQKTPLEITIEHDRFSEFFVQIEYLEKLSQKMKNSLDHLKALKISLVDQEKNLELKKKIEEDEKAKLEAEREELDGNKTFKDQLLYKTKLDESKFQALVEEVRQEQIQANAEIADLEQEMRLRLEQKKDERIGEEILGDTGIFSWPVSPKKGISCGFHCGDYPFKKWFEHSGSDIRTEQGTPVAAGAAGYVTIAKDAGLGYSYILIVHGDGLATVYGHVSRIDVKPEQFVRRGEIIGLSGGTPGLAGTGKFSTGPHLHFEVRVNGIPDDPLKYLPAVSS